VTPYKVKLAGSTRNMLRRESTRCRRRLLNLVELLVTHLHFRLEVAKIVITQGHEIERTINRLIQKSWF